MARLLSSFESKTHLRRRRIASDSPLSAPLHMAEAINQAMTQEAWQTVAWPGVTPSLLPRPFGSAMTLSQL